MGVILAGYLGCFLAAGAFLSVGMLFSAVSRNQVVAFILGVAASTAFLLLGLPETLDYAGRALGGYVEHVLLSLSLIDHFESLTRAWWNSEASSSSRCSPVGGWLSAC